jgi:hypothetical protein
MFSVKRPVRFQQACVTATSLEPTAKQSPEIPHLKRRRRALQRIGTIRPSQLNREHAAKHIEAQDRACMRFPAGSGARFILLLA